MNIDTSKLGDLAVVDSADEFAAAAVLAADTLVHQYLTEGNIRQYVQSEELAAQLVALLENGVDFTYHVSAQRTSYNGVTYWVFGAQAAATPSPAGAAGTELNHRFLSIDPRSLPAGGFLRENPQIYTNRSIVVDKI